MRRLRQPAALGAGLLGLAAPLLAAMLGWLQAPQPWPRATGWSEIPPALRPADDAEGPEAPDLPTIWWLGHSGFLLRWPDLTLAVDANLSANCLVARRVLEPAAPAAELGTVDAALVSHPHFDHLDLPTLAGLQGLRHLVVPAGSQGYVDGARRAAEVVALEPWAETRVGPVRIVALPTRHNGNRHHPFRSERAAVGYLIERGGARVYYAGDTGYGPHLAEIGRRYEPQLAILPIGAYSPSFPMLRYHLSPEQAVLAAADLGVELVVPSHFGTFRLSLDRPDAALPRFAQAAAKAGVRWRMPRLARGDRSPS
ncbi:MAG: MBL fold metallo-hydrolase [Thermoanaerobaculia bacterium]|nr:MBL fold metallo-hydrolase [Thermoanaerobaculia bacterium]